MVKFNVLSTAMVGMVMMLTASFAMVKIRNFEAYEAVAMIDIDGSISLLFTVALMSLLVASLGVYSSYYRKRVLFALYSLGNGILFMTLFAMTIICWSMEVHSIGTVVMTQEENVNNPPNCRSCFWQPLKHSVAVTVCACSISTTSTKTTSTVPVSTLLPTT